MAAAYGAAVRIGVVVLPEFSRTPARVIWQRVESLGFDHAWTYDHLAWRTLRDGPWYGTVPFLAAAAVVTERIRLGTLVASPNFRHPVPFARELITLDDLSAGRIVLGIGAGGLGWDAVMLGGEPWSPSERSARFEEFVTLLDLLLREPETTYGGRFYSAVEARTYPGCVQQPRVPFAVAGTGRVGMRLAATFGETWVTTGDLAADGSVLDAQGGVRVVSEQMKRLDAACAGVGRDPRSLARMVLTGPRLDPGLSSLGEFEHVVGRFEEVGVTDLVVHWPRPEPPYAGDPDVFEQIVGAVITDVTRR
jgi:alkanesulfonate monooxygenase SsuD/methylene tetrahydromethanopterin reductase-like flavin-dependent oxidoreductase (luciferase family)